MFANSLVIIYLDITDAQRKTLLTSQTARNWM